MMRSSSGYADLEWNLSLAFLLDYESSTSSVLAENEECGLLADS